MWFNSLQLFIALGAEHKELHYDLNIKGQYRVSTNYRCCPAGTPSDITDMAVYRNMRYQFSSGTVIEDRLKQHE